MVKLGFILWRIAARHNEEGVNTLQVSPGTMKWGKHISVSGALNSKKILLLWKLWSTTTQIACKKSAAVHFTNKSLNFKGSCADFDILLTYCASIERLSKLTPGSLELYLYFCVACPKVKQSSNWAVTSLISAKTVLVQSGRSYSLIIKAQKMHF